MTYSILHGGKETMRILTYANIGIFGNIQNHPGTMSKRRKPREDEICLPMKRCVMTTKVTVV